MFLVIVLLTSLWITNGTRLPQSKLHDFMDEEELKFYFGSETIVPDYEIVDLPESLLSSHESVIDESENNNDIEGKRISFKVFNKQVKLDLHLNKHLLSPYASIVKKTSNGTKMMLSNGEAPTDCHYLHIDSSSSAAISNCEPKEIQGLIFLPDDTFEILPLNSRLKFVINRREYSTDTTKDGIRITKIPHLVKRSSFPPVNFENDFLESRLRALKSQELLKQRGVIHSHPTVELGLFFDEAFYNFFAPFFNFDNEKLRNFILSYINGVQSLYHHHSLGRKVQFTIVYLELMERQPVDMPHAYGERHDLIDNFCRYQKSKNPTDDRDPGHWDMSVYVSALDFFAWDSNGVKNSVTMGLATVGGVCNEDYNCVIVEFGSINQFGRPYPSSGYTAVYILAHEIGHNLGMAHDSSGNACDKDGFVMSPSRGTQGKTTWSPCSANIVRQLDWAKCLYDKPSESPGDIDPWKYNGYPGITFTAKDQCEILLRDHDAYTFVKGHQSSVCDNLHCRTPNRAGFFFAGPALQGTECGYEKWCESGMCVSRKALITTTTRPRMPTWSPWRTTTCKSECIKQSKGIQTSSRKCSGMIGECEGDSFSVSLCDDSKICSSRKPVMDYGTQKCKEFSRKIPNVDSTGYGVQASYDNLRLWMPCAIFCKRKTTSSYYSPRVELNDIGIDPYYPDGTLCHREGKENFYCIQHHCLPENTTLSKSPMSPNDDSEILERIFSVIM